MIVESGLSDLIALNGNGLALKCGDHGAFKSTTDKLITNIVTQIPPYSAHGLLSGFFPPVGNKWN